MKIRWLTLVVLLAAIGVVATASAMPDDVATGVAAPAFDVRPFLEAHPLSDEVVARALQMEGFRPTQGGEVMLEDFESFPMDTINKWLLIDDLDEGHNGYYFWKQSECEAKNGRFSFWAVGGRREGQELTCGDSYPNGARSAAMIRLDLTSYENAQRLDLLFDYWLNLRVTTSPGGVVPDGLFVIYVEISPDGSQSQVVAKGITAQNPTTWFYSPAALDLTNVVDIYDPDNPDKQHDLRGKVALIEFLFISTAENIENPAMGAFIDDVRISSDTAIATNTAEPPDETPTPVVTPTEVVTATATTAITPTATITATAAVTVTPTVVATQTPVSEGLAFLPFGLANAVIGGPDEPEPTEEPAPTDEPTAEMTDEATAEPTDEATVEPTDEPTEEPSPEPPEPVGIAMEELDASGISGFATLTQMGADLEVLVELRGTAMGSMHPMHIHGGSCADLGDVVHALEDVTDGTSTTLLTDTMLVDLRAEAHAINVHLSADDSTGVSCGDVPPK